MRIFEVNVDVADAPQLVLDHLTAKLLRVVIKAEPCLYIASYVVAKVLTASTSKQLTAPSTKLSLINTSTSHHHHHHHDVNVADDGYEYEGFLGKMSFLNKLDKLL